MVPAAIPSPGRLPAAATRRYPSESLRARQDIDEVSGKEGHDQAADGIDQVHDCPADREREPRVNDGTGFTDRAGSPALSRTTAKYPQYQDGAVIPQRGVKTA
jgi:hypothetical protein